jgi:hypothetical protein
LNVSITEQSDKLFDSKPNDKEVLRQKLSKKLHGWKEVLLDEIIHSGVASNLLDILTRLVPILKNHGDMNSSTGRLESIKDFLIKLSIKPLMHLLEISIFSLNNVILRLTKINRAYKNWAHF